MKKKIIIVLGDPNSINSELIYKSWRILKKNIKKEIYVITNYELIKKQFKKLNYLIKVSNIQSINDNINDHSLKILNIDLKFTNPFDVPLIPASKFIKKSLNLAHKLALQKNVKGIINCPIDKKLLVKKNIGVTEYLSSKCNLKDNSEVMLIKNKKLAVSPVTTHIDIKNISKKLNVSKIISKVKTINRWFKKQTNKKPKIAILGLNPHNAEFREDTEENKIILPAIYKLKKLGIVLEGPLVSDTIFIKDYKNFDVIIGMYHDQVLGPFKAIFKFDAINITLGLKYLRTSPDHGVAKNIIGKNKANVKSFFNCIEFVHKFKK